VEEGIMDKSGQINDEKDHNNKWIFKKKVEQDCSIRYKARCVSRGFMQSPGVDYT
jgi:hypothetical protein